MEMKGGSLETFARMKPLVDNPYYPQQKQKALAGLADEMIDRPIVDIVNSFNRLPCCFTLQACYGHFVYKGQDDPHNLAPLPSRTVEGDVEYRIAYIALCIENSRAGRDLLEKLKTVPAIDPENIQLCSAAWFWNQQVNAYALQVEPDRFKYQDRARLGFEEALHIEKIRNRFFAGVKELIATLG
jgi:hypothetical protein